MHFYTPKKCKILIQHVHKECTPDYCRLPDICLKLKAILKNSLIKAVVLSYHTI